MDDPTDVAVIALEVAKETLEMLIDDLDDSIKAAERIRARLQQSLSRFP